MLESSTLTDQHIELRSMVRSFAEKEVKPIAGWLDRNDERIPERLLMQMADLGFFGACIPQEWGGAGMDATSLCIITEELCRANLSVGSVIHRNTACGRILEAHGTDDQKERWLAGIATGRIQTASAGTEPEAGSDAANIQTRARRDGDVYKLSGSKLWCTFADRANILFTYARTSDESKHRGISLLLVEKEPGEEFVPPMLVGTHLETVGYHGMHSYSLHFDELEVPAENLLGGVEGRGFYQLMAAYEIARLTFAFRCIGLAQAAYESALDYTKQRQQFGKPISTFQAVRFKLANMATEIEAARALGFAAARQYDEQKGQAALEAGMVKLFAAEMARRVCWEALYLHGGNGYAVEADVNRFWRDSGLLPIGEGTSDIQREIIARAILGER